MFVSLSVKPSGMEHFPFRFIFTNPVKEMIVQQHRGDVRHNVKA